MPTRAQGQGFDAIVIGAGPAGATAALMLARRGWSVAIVEKRPFPRRKVCGEYISATTWPLIFELGLGDALLAVAGPPVSRAAVFAGEARLAFALPRPADGGGLWGRAVAREHLDHLLLQAAARAGARVHQPWSALQLDRRNGMWSCAIGSRQGEGRLSAPVVIAASGSWEAGPVPLAAANGHRKHDLLAFKARFRGGDLPRDLMPLLAFPGGYGGMVHGATGLNLSCCIRRDRLAALRRQRPSPAGEAVLSHIEESSAAVRDVLKRARLDGAWLAAGPLRPGLRRHPADGLLLVGNLAGEAHPIIAEGISIAMQSALLLTRRLIAGEDRIGGKTAPAAIGEDYAAAWRRAFALRIRAAACFAHLAMRPGAVALLVPVLQRFPRLLALGATLSGKAEPLEFTP